MKKILQFIKNHKVSVTACALVAALSFGTYIVYGQTATSIGDSSHIFNDLTVGGNVGIGTTSPISKMQIKGTGKELRFQADSTNIDNSNAIVFDEGNGDDHFRIQYDGATGSSSTNSGRLRFMPSGGSEVAILRNGNVGVGTNTPSSKLQVSGGVITQPDRPLFFAYGATSDPAPGNYWIFPHTTVNQGNHYSTSTGKFIAPYDGPYYFSWSFIGNNNDTVYRYFLHVNGSEALGGIHLRAEDGAGTGYPGGMSRDAILNLSAGDEV